MNLPFLIVVSKTGIATPQLVQYHAKLTQSLMDTYKMIKKILGSYFFSIDQLLPIWMSRRY